MREIAAISKCERLSGCFLLLSRRRIGRTNLREYVEKIKDEIAKMPSGHTFALRDLVQSPPANLGVKLFENQSALGIRVNSQKDSLDTNTYTKL